MADVMPFNAPATMVLPPLVPRPSTLGGFAIGPAIASFALGRVLALFQPKRAIGILIPDVTVEETGRDDMEITRHPVEKGAAITDHAYMLPAELTIRAGWTSSGSLPGYVDRAYASLLALQRSRVPMVVTAGKRTYPNMLIASIGQTTDSTSENALLATIICREIIIVNTTATKVAPRAQQAQPQNTSETAATGQQQPKPADNISGAGLVGQSLGFGLHQGPAP